ncbi:serine/threonine-protein kinase [Pseudonocardia sp. TRM90224]|uniref:serine/threonine-protein kinase n=1 Tax=Pseudonocardia sp. TRM90224 TaxID=2812678 RepID=UPI001E50CED3|nr:serine/threonine-protein kinase [Pseudonocardia sp. TRM90224]
MNPVNPTRVIGGRYVVLAELGRGGMGIVWRAEDRVIGRHVAVKELHLPSGLSPDERRLFRERLLREARTAGRLNDPGIVTVYDVVTDNDVDHIVMELIEAHTLADIVAANGPLDERTAASVGKQLLDALRTAHEAGVVHRDVKPSNVMIGPGGRVKLTDFGIAQAADDPRLTTTGSMVGSPSYMAPERLDGRPASPATDLWALGVTLCFAVLGVSPFMRETTAGTIAAVLHGEVPSLPVRGPLAAVVSGLMQRDPQLRLTAAQASAMLANLPSMSQQFATGDTTTRVEPPTPQHVQPARRSLRWPLVALGVGLVLGALIGFLVPSLTAARAPVVLTYGEGGDVQVFKGQEGSCYQGALMPGRPVDTYGACTEAHDFEVYAALNPFGTSIPLAYPGREQLSDYATSACGVLFRSDFVVGQDKGKLTFAALVPTQASFEKLSYSSYGSRPVYCVLHTTDGTLITGTRVAQAPQ